jgi:hypothetical protein
MNDADIDALVLAYFTVLQKILILNFVLEEIQALIVANSVEVA